MTTIQKPEPSTVMHAVIDTDMGAVVKWGGPLKCYNYIMSLPESKQARMVLKRASQIR